MKIERFPNKATTDLPQFNEARRSFSALLKAIDAQASQQGWSIHDVSYGPFRAVCAAIVRMNRLHRTLSYPSITNNESRATLDEIGNTIHHLDELISKAQQILINNSTLTDLHHEIISQALIVQQQFPPDLLRDR